MSCMSVRTCVWEVHMPHLYARLQPHSVLVVPLNLLGGALHLPLQACGSVTHRPQVLQLQLALLDLWGGKRMMLGIG
jgi:hypothetical protein